MNHVTLQFLGAAQTVTGSKYLLRIDETTILVDAGLFQGQREWRRKNWEPFDTDPNKIDHILITHAHADHVGYLPVLVKNGYKGPIWMTRGTAKLAQIVLEDASHLQMTETAAAREGKYSKHSDPQPLFTPSDVAKTTRQIRNVEYDQTLNLGADATARWIRAGHILGSASIHVQTPLTSILFSGDLGRKQHPLLRPREQPPGAQWVVMESTYGNRDHNTPTKPHETMARTINETTARGGQILIPAFAIDRTEAVLKTISDLRKTQRIPNLPVYVDSPMGLKALDIYRDETLSELRDDLSVKDFLGINQLIETRQARQSEQIATFKHSCIIITSSGMLEGGRVLHHLERMLPDTKHSIIITGYQALGTRGRQLLDGARNIKIRGRYIPVRAQVEQDREFSAHADRSDLTEWVNSLKPTPQTVFLTHGEREAAESLRDQLTLNIAIPYHGEVVRLT